MSLFRVAVLHFCFLLSYIPVNGPLGTISCYDVLAIKALVMLITHPNSNSPVQISLDFITSFRAPVKNMP